jgi:hypothetical protein
LVKNWLILRQITIFSLGATGGGGGTKVKVKTILFFKVVLLFNF